MRQSLLERLSNRLYQPIQPQHLRVLSQLAMKEREDFFERNTHLGPIYNDRFLAAALCQGAALHYLSRGDGVKDFDIHFFYEQHPTKKRMARGVYTIRAKVCEFGSRKVDFIRTVIPSRFVDLYRDDVVRVVRQFLMNPPTPNARYLAVKAVIGLVPDSVFGTTIWPCEHVS